MASQMSDAAEMKGMLVLAALNTIRQEEISEFLDRVRAYDPDGWYLVKEVRKVLEDIAAWRSSFDSVFDLMSLGASVTQTVPLPPEWNTLEIGLTNYGTYHMQFYRNTGLDWLIKTEPMGKNLLRVRFRINFPDHFMYGWVVGFAKRLLPPGTRHTVYFDPDVKRADEGGDETVVCVKW